MATTDAGQPEITERREVPETRAWRMPMRVFRPSEWLLVIYFFFVAWRGAVAGAPLDPWKLRGGLILAGLVLLFLLARAEYRSGSRLLSIVRDWLPAPLLLVAYWAVDWPVSRAYQTRLELAWLQSDRMLLNHWGGKALIEYFGRPLPFLLEACYSLLYAIPPASLGILYLCRRRNRVDRFLFTLLLGVLTTYLLLPLTPTRSPRIAFPGEDLPSFTTPFRRLNMWLLDHADIQTSVFPSGHVTVGFSAAFGMLLALPERRRIGLTIAAVAIAVAVVTVYGRYHYAADGVAAIAVSLLAYAGGAFLYPALRPWTSGKRLA